MSRKKTRTAAVIMAVLISAACGQKPSTIRESAAARAEEFRPEPAAEPTEEPSGADIASADAGGPAPAPVSPDEAAAPQPLQAGDGNAPALGPPAPAPAPSGPLNRPTRSRRGAATPDAGPSSEPGSRSSAAPAPGRSSAPGREHGPTGPAPQPSPPREALEGAIDRTGVNDTTVRIGIHAPVTGAAPFPQHAFEQSDDLYWKFLAEKGGVHGRNVEVIFRDDKYNPTSAVQACREMVEEQKVFAIIGFAGADQITACARYADSVNVPYFSGGVNEDGLAGLNRYFAISQTYDQQSATLVKLMKNKIKKTKVGIVVIATPSLNNTVRSITSEVLKAGGLQIVRSSRIGKYASDAELLSEAQQLRNSGAEVVYIIAAPIPFIKLATNAQAQAYHPTWIGPGTTNGLAVVAQAGCPSIDGAKFLSPFPQLDAIDELDPDYKPAFRRYVGSNPDDVGILMWGLNKVLHQMLDAAGRDLSRQSFLKTVTSGRVFRSNVYPDVSYDSTIRFGAKTAHLLEADCSTRSWKTTGRFVADF
jgi:ABC-type branched-subunit amino acid transport system substrate-binding protein